MDSPILVNPSQRDSVTLLERLDAARVLISAAYWVWDPEAEADRLILASPQVEKEGPRELYRSIQSALRANPPLTLQLSEITVLPPDAELVQTLTRTLWAPPGQLARVTAAGRGPNGPLYDVVVLRSPHVDTEAFRAAGDAARDRRPTTHS
jgi:hypothetical protein